MPRTCVQCDNEFTGRADAQYCSPTCRKRAQRARNRPYRAEPIGCMTDFNLKIATPRRLKSALNLAYDYDAHQSADALRDELGERAPDWANWIDDTIEWLSVVRDGLRGKDYDERFVASITRWRRKASR